MFFFMFSAARSSKQEIPQDHVKTAPRPLRTLQVRPTCTLRRPKTSPETPQDPSESCPKTVQDYRPMTVQNGSVPPQENPKTAKGGPKTPQDGPIRSKTAPRSPKTATSFTKFSKHFQYSRIHHQPIRLRPPAPANLQAESPKMQ